MRTISNYELLSFMNLKSFLNTEKDIILKGPVTQLGRVPGFGPGSRGFKSHRARSGTSSLHPKATVTLTREVTELAIAR